MKFEISTTVDMKKDQINILVNSVYVGRIYYYKGAPIFRDSRESFSVKIRSVRVSCATESIDNIYDLMMCEAAMQYFAPYAVRSFYTNGYHHDVVAEAA